MFNPSTFKVYSPQHTHTPPINFVHKIKNLLTSNHIEYNTQNLSKSSNLLYKARLHAQKGGGDESTTLTTNKHTSIYCDQQMAHRGKAVHEAIMSSPTDTNMEDLEDTMLIESIQAKRAQESKKGSSSSKRKKITEIATGLKETPKDFWLGIVAMKNLAIDEGVKTKDCRPPTKKEGLIAMGMPDMEAKEMSHLNRRAFPHVK